MCNGRSDRWAFLDPIDVLEAVNYRNLDDVVDEGPSNQQFDSTNAGVEESMRQFAAEVRQADFKVQGLFELSPWLFVILPGESSRM